MSSRRICRFYRPSQIPQDLICTICSDVLEKPLQLPCAHVLCEHCAYEWSRKAPTCPVCRRPFKFANLASAKGTIRQIDELTVVCRFPHCSWLGPKKEIDHHESSCIFSPQACKAEILELLPTYEKTGENDIDTPVISLVTSLYSKHPDVISRLLLKQGTLEQVNEEPGSTLKKPYKMFKTRVDSNQMTMDRFLKFTN